jgi:hypothetical protein
VRLQIKVVMVAMLKLLINGYIIIILLIKHVHHIKHLDMTMDLDVHHKLNVKIVSQEKDVGHNKKLKYMVFNNLDKFMANKL